MVAPALVAQLLHLEEQVPLEVLWLPLVGPKFKLGISFEEKLAGRFLLIEGDSEISFWLY